MTAHGSRSRRGGPSVIRARFRIVLPPEVWVAEVSTTYPEATFRLLTGVPIDDSALELGEVRADDPGPIADDIRSHPDVDAYDLVYADEQRSIAQYEVDEQALYDFLLNSSLPPEFPVIVEDGEMTFDVTATREQFEAFGDALDASARSYELLSVVHTDSDERLLTDRQRECLTLAQRRGYFAVPRECTLAEVADELDVDKSTASETIRRGTARVLEQFLIGRV